MSRLVSAILSPWTDTSVGNRTMALTDFFLSFFLMIAMGDLTTFKIEGFIGIAVTIIGIVSIFACLIEGPRYMLLQNKFKKEKGLQS